MSAICYFYNALTVTVVAKSAIKTLVFEFRNLVIFSFRITCELTYF